MKLSKEENKRLSKLIFKAHEAAYYRGAAANNGSPLEVRKAQSTKDNKALERVYRYINKHTDK